MEASYNAALQQILAAGQDPLDVAIENDNLPFLQWLVQGINYQPSLYAKHFSLAIELGYLDILQYFYNLGNRDDIATILAAINGKLEVLQWLIAHGYPVNAMTFNGAAESGNVQMLQWLYDHGYQGTATAVIEAIDNNRFEALKWLLAHGYPFLQGYFRAAVAGGDLNMIEWLYNNGYGNEPDVLKVAQTENVYNWLQQHGYK